MNNTDTIVNVESEALEIRAGLTDLVINSQSTYDAAVEGRIAAKNWLKNATDYFDALVKPAYQSYKNLLDAKKKVLEPVENTLNGINRALVAWDQEQERIRRAEQARLEAESRKAIEEARLAEALEAQQNGAAEETVDEILSAPVVVTSVAVAERTYEKSSAVIYRDLYSAEVTDLTALVKFIAKNPKQIGLLVADQAALNALARAMKEGFDVPGVKLVKTQSVASGGRR